MDYIATYNSLIHKRQQEPIQEGYRERHHIIPRSCGGTNRKENLVYLTAREHFIAHLLLVKIYYDTPFRHSMIKALFMMRSKSQSHTQRQVNSRWYSVYREDFSNAQRNSQSGSGNSQYGSKWITNGEIELKVRNGEPIPNGWIVSRLSSVVKQREKEEAQRIKRAQREEKVKMLREYHEMYCEYGFDEFKRLTDYPYSKVNLVNTFKRYLPEFIPQSRFKRGNKH